MLLASPSFFRDGRLVYPSRDMYIGPWETMKGLGDNLYSRGPLRLYAQRSAGPVILRTNRPEIYGGIENLTMEQDYLGADAPEEIRSWYRSISPNNILFYTMEDLADGTIYGFFYRRLGLPIAPSAAHYDLPDTPPPPAGLKPGGYIYIKDVTIRADWKAESRACDPEYLDRAEKVCRAMFPGLPIVSTIDPSDAVTLPPVKADVKLINSPPGSLTELQLLSLVKNARLCIGPVCWLVPAAMCAKTPTVIVMGGYQGMNSPEKLTPDDNRTTRYIQTDDPCRCQHMGHDCKKTISNFEVKLRRAAEAALRAAAE